MIAKISGKLIDKSPTNAIIDVQGVGYDVSISQFVCDKLGDIDSDAELFTYLHVREDVLQLFGFSSIPEKQLFMQLISVNGIGPKTAQKIVGGCRVEDFHRHVLQNDVITLSKVPGIGKKTAENIVYELRDRLAKLFPEIGEKSTDKGSQKEKDDAIAVLVSLGYNKTTAKSAVNDAVKENRNANIEELVKASLKYV